MVNKILIALASIFFLYGGYKSYETFSETKALKEDISELNGFIQNKEDSIGDFEEKIENLNQDIATETETLATLTKDRDTRTKAKEKLARHSYAALDKQISEAEEKLKSAESKYNALAETQPLLEEINDLEGEIETLQEDIEDRENQLAFIRKTQAEEENFITTMTQRQQNIKSGISDPTLIARVINVNKEWNQLTIDKGDTAGVVANTALYVIREDKVLADLQVSTLMPNYSILDITQNLKGNDIQVGDKIVAVK